MLPDPIISKAFEVIGIDPARQTDEHRAYEAVLNRLLQTPSDIGDFILSIPAIKAITRVLGIAAIVDSGSGELELAAAASDGEGGVQLVVVRDDLDHIRIRESFPRGQQKGRRRRPFCSVNDPGRCQ